LELIRTVSTEEAKEFAEKMDMEYLETSEKPEKMFHFF